ncbi:hypothetical protein FRC18_000325 [Serendipita sp. 400]|nr:hypothetical protein FRC18_000325 [Serendipita sp. 400]
MVAWTILALALGGASVVQAIGTPLGFGSSTTGGGSAAAATPTSNAQLASWLSDSTARTIVLTSIFDFTNYYGTASGYEMARCAQYQLNLRSPQKDLQAMDVFAQSSSSH